MRSDVVERLAAYRDEMFIRADDAGRGGRLCGEAADEIDKLRTALQSIAANTCCDRCREAALVAQSALTE